MILRIQNQISVDMSSQWADFHPSYAVDGNEETLPDDCHCCAGTTNTPPYWWRLNLGREYIIKTIIFIGRSDCKYFLFLFFYPISYDVAVILWIISFHKNCFNNILARISYVIDSVRVKKRFLIAINFILKAIECYFKGRHHKQNISY